MLVNIYTLATSASQLCFIIFFLRPLKLEGPASLTVEQGTGFASILLQNSRDALRFWDLLFSQEGCGEPAHLTSRYNTTVETKQ